MYFLELGLVLAAVVVGAAYILFEGTLFGRKKKAHFQPQDYSSVPVSPVTSYDEDDEDFETIENAHRKYDEYQRYSETEMKEKAESFYKLMSARRSIRSFSRQSIDRNILRQCIKTAGTAPSGVHTQPWTYVVVWSSDMKRKIRDVVEKEEQMNYERRMARSWIRDLAKLGTSWEKACLTDAPAVICVFRHTYGLTKKHKKAAVYYPEQSVGISVGLLLCALQQVGLVALTQCPLHAEPEIKYLLGRPDYERLFLLIPVGYPAPDATVPNLQRKPLEEILVEIN